MPSTPPFAFHSSAASLTALTTSWPGLASAPVSGAGRDLDHLLSAGT
jgi:hypothetical protein